MTTPWNAPIKHTAKKLISAITKGAPAMTSSPKQFNLSVRVFSQAFWVTVLQNSTHWSDSKIDLIRAINQLDQLRSQADYNTGSIPAASAWCLYSVVRYFKVNSALEIGTFIGKSTTAIALAMDHEGQSGVIHTCDGSNAIAIPYNGNCRIEQYMKKTSTEMFKGLGGAYNFAHFDGRIQREDIPYLRQLFHPSAIIALDDFEGMEKGVANLMLMREHDLMSNHFLVYPCQASLTRELGFSDESTTAVLLPKSLISYTNQMEAPLPAN
jgi:hypothetical protein